MDNVKILMNRHVANSCYFRSSVEPPFRKAIIQITERCNLHCAHCFVSAGDYGDTMPLEVITDVVIPRLKQCRVIRTTLTGGEPFNHLNIIEIVQAFKRNQIEVGICTSATTITNDHLSELIKIGNIHVNVSLDGFKPESHGKFRGDVNSFEITLETIRKLARYGLLQGLLVTPNNLSEVNEYSELCNFAVENGASYVLMNPLSKMGRGVKSKDKLGSSREVMNQIHNIISPFSDKTQVVLIRFPNNQLPLASCEAGNIIYVFVHGELTICPYLVFAAKTPQSKHKPDEFIVGNIIFDSDIAAKLDLYKFHERYRLGDNTICKSCSIESTCGKGCPAAVIASGKSIEQVDDEVCPMINILN